MTTQFPKEMIDYVTADIHSPITPDAVAKMWRRCDDKVLAAKRPMLLAKAVEVVVQLEPVDMVLYCPRCGVQHIDTPEDRCVECPGGACMCVRQRERWTNPPHKSHLCQNKRCNHIWRPSDTPTNGVARTSSGKDADIAPFVPKPTIPEGWDIDLQGDELMVVAANGNPGATYVRATDRALPNRLLYALGKALLAGKTTRETT